MILMCSSSSRSHPPSLIRSKSVPSQSLSHSSASGPLPPDPSLIRDAQENPHALAWDLLYTRYNPLLTTLCRQFTWAFLPPDEVRQIARIGFWQAIQSYSATRRIPLTPWVRFIVRRRLKDALRQSWRFPTQVLWQALRPDGEDSEVFARLIDTRPPLLADPQPDSERAMDFSTVLRTVWAQLTPQERRVLTARLGGASYEHIAYQLGLSRKTVDNALQRVRRKGRHLLSKRQDNL